jgi:phosphoribosylformimino-5-aminoimidazole carboxamide ribotide isomerase
MTSSDVRQVPVAMELYCAVDIMDGGAVRLTQGDFAKRTDHGDPVELALRYVREGARFLHVVDLDAARGGEQVNRATVLRIVEESGVPVQVGGGARRYGDAALLLEAGAERVVVSTAAVEEPELVDELVGRYPNRIVLGLDHRSSETGPDHRSSETSPGHRSSETSPDHRSSETGPDHSSSETGVAGEMVAVRGWEHRSTITVGAFLDRFAHAALGAVVVTSIARDGMLTGPDVSGLEGVMSLTGHPVVASGGVRSAADLADLARVSVVAGDGQVRRIAGVVVGRALADGSLRVEEALAACERFG